MLDVLCGNKNVEKILIFLFVNGKCYGTQLSRSFHSALTPIQKALSRLEKGGIITSYNEGKTKLYHLNPSYPLLDELEKLLKKAYTLLPLHHKRDYYVFTPDAEHENPHETLLNFWKRLSQVKRLTFHAKSKEERGETSTGQGDVIVIKANADTLIYQEKGTWQNKQGEQVRFTNSFRWTLDRHAGVISLEHLRHGPEHPVFLFHLAPASNNSLSSLDSHLSGATAYFGHIHLDPKTLRLNWRVIGPKRNEEIDYYYKE